MDRITTLNDGRDESNIMQNLGTHNTNSTQLNDNINAYYDSPAVLLFEELAQQQIHLGYWDDKYPHVGFAQAAKRLTQIVIDQIDIPKGANFLDIGCGCGLPAIEIVKQKNCYLEGITINPQQQAKASTLAEVSGVSNRASFCVGDASDLPYADHQFNGALLLESIHHIGHQEALAEAWRVLKPGGTVLIADGVVLKDEVADTNKSMLAETFVAKSLLTESEIKAQLKQTGFTDIEVIDLTQAIQPTWSKLVEATSLNKTAIIKEYDIAFFEMLLDFWEQMSLVWSQNAKYLIIKANKV